jgi:hypothetical protein
MKISAFCPSALVGVFAFILVDAKSAGSIQFVATWADTFKATVCVFACAWWWTNSLNWKKIFLKFNGRLLAWLRK